MIIFYNWILRNLKIKNGGEEKMRKSIGMKVLFLIAILGIMMIAVTIVNVIALQNLGDYNKEIESKLATYEEAVASGDTTDIAILEEEMDDYFSKSDAKVEGTYTFDLIIVIVAIVACALCVLTAIITIAKPARKAGAQVTEIISKIETGKGDLTDRIEIKSKDEIGQLVDGFNDFIGNLQMLMRAIKEESENLLSSATNVAEHVDASNENAVSVSAAMQQMSASMEEIAATVEQIASGSNKVLEQLQEVGVKAGEGTELVEAIRQNSTAMYKETVDSKEKATSIIQEIRGELETSVEESKSVEKIKELTEEILGIAGQTNLLALNASIEAARAGEAGRGFAVVADQIRVLADSSKNTANNIQEISGIVMNAVEKLSTNAENMLKFVDEEVIKDYDGFVNIVKQYQADAESMNNLLTDFTNSAASVNDVMQTMNQGLNDITITVDESAKGITEVAESTSDLVNAMSLIKEETMNNERISKALSDEVHRFEVV